MDKKHRVLKKSLNLSVAEKKRTNMNNLSEKEYTDYKLNILLGNRAFQHIIQREPELHVSTGTTDELRRELRRLRLERRGRQNQNRRSEYDELIRKLRIRIANRGNSGLAECNINLRFNGRNLTVSGAQEASFPAVSGKQDNQGKFDYSQERQRLEDQGPIPEGIYWLNPNELKDLWYYWFHSRLNAAWGGYRITIHPFDSTHTFGRGGFFIHGGTIPGSAGCIDLTNYMQYFVQLVLEQYVGQDCKIILTVQYTNN